MYSQMFNLLDKADDNTTSCLFMYAVFDEFANIANPEFDKLIATIRSREISASIILQSSNKTIYKDAADTIVGNCDATLFRWQGKVYFEGDREVLVRKPLTCITLETRSINNSYGLNYQSLKELMSQDEIAVMDGGKCL